jgi:hypothetical protein
MTKARKPGAKGASKAARPRAKTNTKTKAKAKRAGAKTTRSARVAVPDAGQPGSTLKVSIPTRTRRGAVSREDVAEAAAHVRTLEENAQISRRGGKLPPGATHSVERDADGGKTLVRKRFSAI